MKLMKAVLSAVMLTSCLTAVSAADAPKDAPKHPAFTTYSQPGPTLDVVKDDNAYENVRNQYDFTVPVHGPVLSNPEYGSITVMWITRMNCGAGIEYREKGQTEFKRVWDKIYGQIDYSKRLHTLHLTGLKPATEYEYRLVSASDRWQAYDQTPKSGREIYTFKTLDPDRKSYQVFFSADIHGSLRLILDPMLDRTPAKDSDFFIYIGDNVEDTLGPDPEYFITFGFVDDIVRRYGTRKASVFVRGNHDSNGPLQYDYHRYFPHRTGKSYYSFSQGGVLFVVLEDAWHYSGKGLDSEMFGQLMTEQLEWFRELKKTDAWKKAEFRVLNAHIATFASGSMTPEWSAELSKDSPQDRVHLFMSGHDHRYMRINPGAKESKVFEFKPRDMGMLPKEGDTHAYCNVVGEQGDVILMKVEPGKLTLTSYIWNKDPVQIRDSFSITPDGKVTDLADVKTFPFPEKPAPKPNKKK